MGGLFPLVRPNVLSEADRGITERSLTSLDLVEVSLPEPRESRFVMSVTIMIPCDVN